MQEAMFFLMIWFVDPATVNRYGQERQHIGPLTQSQCRAAEKALGTITKPYAVDCWPAMPTQAAR